MQNLTDRQIKCIKLLLEEHQYRSSNYYSQKLHVSEKTLLQDLKVLQKYLMEFGIHLERKTGRGIFLDEEAKRHREFLNDLERQQNIGKPVSVTLRRWEILRRLLMNPEQRTSIQKLSEEFYVSRASVVNDFKYIENWLEIYELNLVKDTEGHHIAGNEDSIRRAIAAMMTEYQPSEKKEQQIGHNYLDDATRGCLTELFPEEEVTFIESLLGKLETVSGSTIREPYYINLLTHILICLFRTREGKRIEQADGSIDINTYKSFEYAKGLAEDIQKKFGLDIGEAEIYYIYKYLISSGIGIEVEETKRREEPSAVEEDIGETIARDLTGCVSRALKLDVNKNSQIKEGLLLHIRPMLNRLKFDISIKSEILEDIQSNYGELLGLCQAAMWCVSKKYSLKEASLDELSYIAIYYQAMAEAGRLRKRILVVCHSGLGTSQLLETKLRMNFPSWDIAEVISARQLEKRENFENIDFIISTVPLEVRAVPYILISAVLSDRDIQKIRNVVSIDKDELFSFKIMEEQFYSGELEYKTEEEEEEIERFGKSVHVQKQIRLGRRIRLVIGIRRRRKTVIYRRPGSENEWVVLTCAPQYDDLLLQLAELYQMLCTSWGEQIMEKVGRTEELKKFLEPFAGQNITLIPEKMICMNLDAGDKESAIRQMIPLFTDAGILEDEETFYQDVMERESLALTSVGQYVVIPHGVSEAVIRPGIAIGRLIKKIRWTSDETLPEDEQYAKVIIMFAVHPGEEKKENGIYLRMLKHVFGRLGEPKAIEGLIAAKSSEEIRKLFQ